MARRSGYKAEYAAQAAKLAKLGATDEDLADFFEVSIRTIHNWKAQHAGFLHALKDAKEEADARVERSLYQRAMGYSFDAVKILSVSKGHGQGSEIEQVPYREHVPPDVTACIFWLKNRKPQDWRDKHEHEHAGKNGGPITVSWEG